MQGFTALPTILHLGGRGFFSLAWGEPQNLFRRPVPLRGEKVMGAGSGTWTQYPLLLSTSPVCPSRKEAGLCPRVEGLTLTSDVGLECQPIRFQTPVPFPKGKVGSELLSQVKAGSLSALLPAVECSAGMLLRNKACDLQAMA